MLKVIAFCTQPWKRAWTLSLLPFGLLAMSLGYIPPVTVAFAQEVPFGAPSTLALGSIPRSVVLGDLNGDGAPDAAVVSGRGVRSVSVLLGTGTGSFGPASNFPVVQSPFSLAFGDFDLDAKLDLAVISFVSLEFPPPNSTGVNTAISILPGDGAGSFGTARTVEFDGFPCSSAIGDFNQDGKPDLAVVNLTRPTADQPFVLGVAILLGDGNGSFGAPNNVALAEGFTPACGDVVVGDFNGDGRLDVAVGEPSFFNGIFVLPGDGSGGFGTALRSSPGGGGLGGFAAGDFHQDGKLDLVARGVAGLSIQFHRGDGSGTFAAPVTIVERPFTWVGSIVVGDVNQDGKQDLVVGVLQDCCVSVLLGTGTGTFENPRHFTFGLNGGGETSVAIGDLNRDGKPDLVAVNEGNELLATFLNMPLNQPPQITAFSFTPSFVDPFVGFSVFPILPLTISFSVTASDPDGIIEEVRWDFDGDGVTDQMTTTLSTSFTYINAESFGAADIFRATATVVDNAGATAAAVTTATLLAPQQFISNILGLVSGFIDSGDIKNPGIAQSLSANLNNASSALTREQRTAANKSLQVELNKLNSFVQSGQITPIVRDTLAPLINTLLSSL